MAVALFTSATAQETNKSKPEPSLTSAMEKTVINLWPGVAPGSEQWKQPETFIGSVGKPAHHERERSNSDRLFARSLHRNCTSVIIAPGGGFVWLSIDSEGHDVAKWLAARGIAAFVLKYRLLQVEGQEPAQVAQSASAALGAVIRDRSLMIGIANTVLRTEFRRSKSCAPTRGVGHLSERVVLTGFSAGAILTSAVVLQSDAPTRNYAAPIYGGPYNRGCLNSAGTAPIFLAVAQGRCTRRAARHTFYDAA